MQRPPNTEPGREEGRMGSIRHFNDDDAAEIAGHIETLAGKGFV